MMLASIFFVVLLLPGPCRAFDAGFLEVASAPQKDKDKDKDTTHYGITVCALCRVTIDYLKSAYKMDVGLLEKKFNVTNGQCPQSSVRDIITALRNSGSRDINPWQFATMVKSIASANTKTDLKEMLKAESHFDSEKFHGSSQLVLKRYEAALNSILTADNYDQARKAFGEMLHTLQDFYSHTNFIELGFAEPSDVLGQRIFRDDEYAPVSMRTCVSCKGDACQTKPNLDADLQRKKLLTSGYFIPVGLNLFTRKKPKGKCSHGGTFDSTQDDEPIGGINKDKLNSVHGHMHYQAANMAYLASVKILSQLRKKINDERFGLFLTLKKNLNSLVISIDTACSMADYVELAKAVSIDIVNQYGGLEFAPHNYILVSFNSQRAEVVVNTRDPKELTEAIKKLNSCQKANATVGEMYYHSLIEGLKQCEYASVMYTFTDSPARDAYLKNQVRALLRSKRAVIYSFLGKKMQQRLYRASVDVVDPLDGSNGDLDLASISGGLTFPIVATDRTIVSEFVLRRLEWTRLQSVAIFTTNSTSMAFEVDPSIDELHLDISSMGEGTDLTRIQLRRPDNSYYPLAENSMSTKHLYMWKIARPAAGTWLLTATNLFSASKYEVQIQGRTSIACTSTLQKEMEADKDSSGYTQLTTEPIIRSELLVLTACDSVLHTNATVSLISPSGRVIATYSASQLTQSGTLAKIRVPSEQFRIQTVAILPNGAQIQRIEKQLISPTPYSIELIDQPFIIGLDETIQMNYTIRSATDHQVTLRLQISDTLQLLGSDSIERDVTFINETSGTQTLKLPKNYAQKFTTDSIIFTVSVQNNQTKKFSYENDETVSAYLDVNSAPTGRALNYMMTMALTFFAYHMRP